MTFWPRLSSSEFLNLSAIDNGTGKTTKQRQLLLLLFVNLKMKDSINAMANTARAAESNSARLTIFHPGRENLDHGNVPEIVKVIYNNNNNLNPNDQFTIFEP